MRSGSLSFLLLCLANALLAASAVSFGSPLCLERLLPALVATPLLLFSGEERRFLPASFALPAVAYGLVLAVRALFSLGAGTPPFPADLVPLLLFLFLAAQVWLLSRGQVRREAEHQAAISRASERKSDFFVNMSQEIRSPLTAILGYADLLIDSSEGSHREQAEIIKKNGQRLLDLLTNLLDLTKLEAGGLAVSRVRCNIEVILGELKEELEPLAQRKGLQLELRYRNPIPEIIHTDPLRLRQVLRNLVHNGIQFTEEGFVRLEVACEEVEGEPARLVFVVRDTGAGMTQEQLRQPFQPLSPGQSAGAGLGLGLALCDRLTTLLGGLLAVDSQPGRGSTFTVCLDTGPLSGVRRVARPEPPPPSPSIRPLSAAGVPRVLLAEDAADSQQLVAAILRRAGAVVAVADNGRIAVQMALSARSEGKPYDVLLLDTRMPIMNGHQATEELRKLGYDQPIVALSAFPEEDQARGQQVGCDASVSKPIDRVQLLEMVRRARSGELRRPTLR